MEHIVSVCGFPKRCDKEGAEYLIFPLRATYTILSFPLMSSTISISSCVFEKRLIPLLPPCCTSPPDLLSSFHSCKAASAFLAIPKEEGSSAHQNNVQSSHYAPIVSDTYPATAMRTQSPQVFHNDPP